MGFNFSGIAINESFEDDIETVENLFGWTLTEVATVDFEQASGNWKEDGICDIYFTENATLIFLCMDMCTVAYPLAKLKTLSFVLSEGSMSFSFNLTSNKEVLRSIVDSEGIRLEDSGSVLESESGVEDLSEVIWTELDNTLGVKFNSIDLFDTAKRYTLATSNPSQNSLNSEAKAKQEKSTVSDSLVSDEIKEGYVFKSQKNNNSLRLLSLEEPNYGRMIWTFELSIDKVPLESYCLLINTENNTYVKFLKSKMPQNNFYVRNEFTEGHLIVTYQNEVIVLDLKTYKIKRAVFSNKEMHIKYVEYKSGALTITYKDLENYESYTKEYDFKTQQFLILGLSWQRVFNGFERLFSTMRTEDAEILEVQSTQTAREAVDKLFKLIEESKSSK